MAFSMLMDSFLVNLLTQIATDYSLDIEEMKERYITNPQVVVAPVVEKEKKAPVKAKEKKAPVPAPANGEMSLSKMKKQDFIDECEAKGLSSKGTVAELKARVQKSRLGGAPPAAAPPAEAQEDTVPVPPKKKKSSPKKKKEKEPEEEIPVTPNEDDTTEADAEEIRRQLQSILDDDSDEE